MEHQDLLHTISEIAAALVGFSGIVVSIGHREAFSSQEVRRFLVMLRAGFSALFLGLLPQIVCLFIQDEWVWQTALCVLALLMFSNLYNFWRRGRFGTMHVTQLYMFPPGVVIASCAALAAAGFIPGPDKVYIVALVWMLIIASQNFVLLLMDSISVKDD